MQILPYIYLAYMFVSLYFLFFYIIIYLSNRDKIYEFPKITKKYSLSVLIPVHNEQDTIEETVNAILISNYLPQEIILIDDKSTDKTPEICNRLARNNDMIKVIHNKVNLRKAGALNEGIKIAKGELVAVIDADSYISKDSFEKLIGFFDDNKVGVASAKILPKNNKKLLEKFQALEYAVIAWTRKLLGFVDAIYVTPGPLSIYRKSALVKVKGFDTKNMTEDIEMTWKLVYYGYKVRMSLSSHVETSVPDKFKMWWRQRQRWNIGGLQCLHKYGKFIFHSSKNMLGWFIVPYFATTLVLGLVGLSIFSYLIIQRIISKILFTHYASIANVPVLTLNNFYFTASVLNYLGVILFVFGLGFTIFALSSIKPKDIKIYSPLLLLGYLIVYLTIYPILLVLSLIRMIRGDYGWW